MSQFNYGGYPGNQQMQNLNNQYPYNDNNLIMSNPYNNNYMVNKQNLQTQYLKCRPVASKEEARAAQIDLDGSLWVFTDVANGKIYTKQINVDGTAAFNTYAFIKDETPSYNSSDFVTKDEFNKVIQNLMASISTNTNDARNNNNDNSNLNNKNNIIPQF